jgi:hypothetical protein
MKPSPLAFALLLAILPVESALAGGDGVQSPTIRASCCDPPARWAPRHDAEEARFVIKSREGHSVLLLTDEVVALQLSDRTLRDFRREIRNEQEEEEDNVLSHAIKSAVLSGVRTLFNKSAECPVRHLRDVEYRNERLVVITKDGEHLFENVEVNDEDVLSSFSERDAKAFVREFRKLKAARDR